VTFSRSLSLLFHLFVDSVTCTDILALSTLAQILGFRNGQRLREVKALSPHHRFVIVLHSPDGVAETGLCVWPPEKSARKLARGLRRDRSAGEATKKVPNCSPFCSPNEGFTARVKSGQNHQLRYFSIFWRRGRDSIFGTQ
jgi:hypothetical protein